MTKTLPADKNGNVYYGPTTYEAAVSQIDDGRDALDVWTMLLDAGYTGIARRIRKDYSAQIETEQDMNAVD